MNTCATCKHWKLVDPDDYLDPTPWHAPVADWPRWGWCGLIGLPITGEDSTVLPVYVQDGSDYKATLYCRDDFGCTLHEPKVDG